MVYLWLDNKGLVAKHNIQTTKTASKFPFYTVDKNHWFSLVKDIKANGFIFLQSITCTDNSPQTNTYNQENTPCNLQMVYIFMHSNLQDFVGFYINLVGVFTIANKAIAFLKTPTVSIDTISYIYPSANWLEREVHDLFGVNFHNHPNLKRIMTHQDFQGHALLKSYPTDYNQQLMNVVPHTLETEQSKIDNTYANADGEVFEDVLYINIGPAHPATHGTLRFMSVLDGGEKILDMDVEIGYLHRCFEKMCEQQTYNQIVPYTDRLNYCSAPMNNNGYCHALETMLGITIPEKAMLMRMLLDELSRIIDHFVCVGTNLVDLGALTPFFHLFQERELVYDLFEKLCGARLTVSMMRVGGMGFDIPEGWLEQCLETVNSIEKTHTEMFNLVKGNRIFVERCKFVGSLTQQQAVDFSITGPALRATGFAYDIRKERPYWLYHEVDFDIPLGSRGDTYDRYLVRMEEVYQSLRIVRWCVRQLQNPAISTGPMAVYDKTITLPDKKQVYGNIEGLMNHFMMVINGVKVPRNSVYTSTEAANGELGFYVVSDGTGRPHRLHCRAPSLFMLQAFPTMAKKQLLSDAVTTLGSINIIAGELDR
jgi:NADH-quinone oxidoreductase subunit C/D